MLHRMHTHRDNIAYQISWLRITPFFSAIRLRCMQPCCWRQLNATAAALELAKTARDPGSAELMVMLMGMCYESAQACCVVWDRSILLGMWWIVHVCPCSVDALYPEKRLCTFKSHACWWSMVVTNSAESKKAQVVRQLDRSIKGVQKAFDFAKSFDDFQTCRHVQPESDLWC